MLSLPAVKHPYYTLLHQLPTAGKPRQGSVVAEEIQAEREMLVQHTATAKSAALCTALIKNQIVLVISSLGPFPWLGELGREWALCAIQSMTALLWLDFCASHKALLCEEYLLFPFKKIFRSTR